MLKVVAWVVGIAVVLFFAGGFMLSSSPVAQDRQHMRDAIAMCWKDQGRKALDPSTARLAAGACEMMERRFVEKYGRQP